MQRFPRLEVLLAALMLGVLSVSAAVAQTDQDEVKAVVDGLRTAMAKGDTEAIGKLISDSGFVGAIELGEDANFCDKNGFLALLKASLPPGGLGDDLKLDDVTVQVHHTVAFINAKLTLPGMAAEPPTFFDAVAFRDMGKWQLCALMAAQEAGKIDEASVKALTDRVAALPDAVKKADLQLLDDTLDNDHLILCFVDPSLELRWTSSKPALVGMIQGILGMVTINQSKLDVSRTQAGRNVAVVDGSWLLDIPEFGQTNSTVRAYAAKHDDQWKIIVFAGGPPG